VEASVPATVSGGALFLRSEERLLKVSLQVGENERLRRVWLTRPDLDWHVRRQQELSAVGNAYGVAIQRWAEQNARGMLAFEAGNFDRAWGHFIVAAATRPQPPTAALTDRRFWVYDGGWFEKRADGSWMEIDGSRQQQYAQTAVTAEFVELYDQGRATSVRLWADRMMILKVGRDTVFRMVQGGRWEHPPTLAPPPREVAPRP
jgi:hypothetical protein